MTVSGKEHFGSIADVGQRSGLEDQRAELKAKRISIARTTTSDYVKIATAN